MTMPQAVPVLVPVSVPPKPKVEIRIELGCVAIATLFFHPGVHIRHIHAAGYELAARMSRASIAEQWRIDLTFPTDHPAAEIRVTTSRSSEDRSKSARWAGALLSRCVNME